MHNVEYDEQSLRDLDSDQEDPDFHKFLEDIIDTKDYKKMSKSKGKKKTKGSGKAKANKESQELMQKANQYFFERRNLEAMEKAKEAVVADPDNSDAFHLMHMIYEELGDKENMLNCLGLAATLESNTEIWLK